MTDVIDAQRAALQALYLAHVAPGSPYALVDFPDHPNVGDSAIWLGEWAMLTAITGRAPDYVSTWHDFDGASFRSACPAGTLFLHGGGNLGDIWPHHQRFREQMLTAVRDRPVVQLPQSIHFADARARDRFAAIVAAHPDFTLYVRDRESLALAQRHFACPSFLAPDSAFALGAQTREPATTAVLALMRSDAEQQSHAGSPPPGVTIVDWLEDDPGLPEGTMIADRHAQAQLRVARGLRLLSRGETVVTDRLHGHILALLLGIPHVAFDNSYGKLAAYSAAWTQASPLLQLARDWRAVAAPQPA